MSTSKNLEKMAERGEFNPDLLMIISVVPVVVPPLRDHMEDLPILVNDFLQKLSIEHAKPPRALSQEAMQALEAYDWPKNILELRFVLEHALLLGTSHELQLSDLPLSISSIRKLEQFPAKSQSRIKPNLGEEKSPKYKLLA